MDRRSFSPNSRRRPRRFRENDLLIKSLWALIAYIFVGTFIYSVGISVDSSCFSGEDGRTHPLVDAFYFVLVSLCLVGYGDIAPEGVVMRVIFSIYNPLGMLVILPYVTLLEVHIRREYPPDGSTSRDNWLDSVLRGFNRRRILWASLLVGFLILVGVAGILIFESSELGRPYEKSDITGDTKMLYIIMDAFYFSVTSVTKIGFGDFAFKTTGGRVFACFWIPVSVHAYARLVLVSVEGFICWAKDINGNALDLLIFSLRQPTDAKATPVERELEQLVEPEPEPEPKLPVECDITSLVGRRSSL